MPYSDPNAAAGKDLLSAALHGAASGVAMGSVCILGNDEVADFILAQADIAFFVLCALACGQTGIATALTLRLGFFSQND